MGRAQVQKEIAQLKNKLKESRQARNSRLVKMLLVLIVIALIAGWKYGRIHFQF